MFIVIQVQEDGFEREISYHESEDISISQAAFRMANRAIATDKFISREKKVFALNGILTVQDRKKIAKQYTKTL